MLAYPGKKCLFFVLVLPFFIAGCVDRKQAASDKKLDKEFAAVEALMEGSDTGKVIRTLTALRSHIDPGNPKIIKYYLLKSALFVYDAAKQEKLADSALAFFSKAGIAQNYPAEYVQALLLKAHACISLKKYDVALYYYYEGKVAIQTRNDPALLSDFTSKIAAVYFNQKNYLAAARYWAQSVALQEKGRSHFTPEKFFYLEEGNMDNAGLAYDRAGMLDSALYYYQWDLANIERNKQNTRIKQSDLNNALRVVYDNLGGLYLETGDLTKAKFYLQKCMAINQPVHDGAQIPPLNKLADLYIRLKEFKKADSALRVNRLVLNVYNSRSASSEITWNKLMANLYFGQNNLRQAYKYLQAYIRVKDSVEKSKSDFYKYDVDSQFNLLKQRDAYQALEKNEQQHMAYLWSAAVFFVMLLFIVVLSFKTLRNAKKNNYVTRQHNAELKRTLEKLEKANKDYIRIMRIMAHDLKNPLSGMTGLISMLLADNVFSEENTTLLKLVVSTGTHSIEMINELLKSGLANEEEEMPREEVNLSELLFESVELLQFRAAEKRQQITFEGDKAVMAFANREKMWRVFNNLIVNAIKFSYEDSVIKVCIAANGNCASISVADNGIGISNDEKEKVFEMFSPAKKQGTSGEQPFGLGLSISRRIIEKHSGKLWFEPNPAGGTIFHIEVPSAPGPPVIKTSGKGKASLVND